MSKWIALASTSLILVLVLAACAGGDDDDAEPTVTTTAGAAITAATETATRPAVGSDSVASPSASPADMAPATTPTVNGTAPTQPNATPLPTEPAATATPIEADGVSAVEAELMDALLQPEDFSSDWTQDTFGPMEPDTDDSDELCGQPPFPDRDQRIAGVEAEYSLNTSEPAFVVHNIVLFPEETAIDAIAYAREISSCGEWTDEEGRTFTIVPLDAQEYGDESYTASMSFEIDGTPFYGEYTFVRVGGAIATVAFITVEGADVSAHQAMVGVAVERLEDADISDGSAGSALAGLLLLPEDVALIDVVND